MKQSIITILFLAMASNCIAQSFIADSLRNEGQLDHAISEYKKVFAIDSDNRNNSYNLACALALTYYQNDSAFYYLNYALKTDSSLWALADPDLIALIEDEQWSGIVSQQMAKYQFKNGELTNPVYAEKLLQLIMKDQALDYQIDMARKYYMKMGQFPHWYYPIATMKNEISESNFEEMQLLLDRYGWPKYSTVGKLAADAPLLVINHQESEDARIMYLSTIKEHCLMSEGSCMEYAKIQDRILVNTGQLQIYGMQFRYTDDRKLEPFPIVDPEFVDQRRFEIGLEPIKDYLKRKIDYDWTIIQKQK